MTMINSQTQNKQQIGQLNHKKRLVPIYGDYNKNDIKIGLGTYRKPNGETYIKLDEIPTTTAYTAKTINGNDVVTDNGKIYGNTQEEANSKYGRYRLTHPNETARRADQYMAQKYGSEWRDNSKYGMKPTMEAFNAITAGMLNRLSPTQNARLIYDLATNPSKGINGMFNGNMGIVTDKFAQEHPWLSLGANVGGDIIALGGPSLYNAGKNAITNSKPYRARQIAKEMNKTFNGNIVYEDSPLISKQIYMEYPKNPTKSYTTNKPQIQSDSPLLLTGNKNNQILSLPYYKDNSKEIARAITRDEAKRINAWSKLYGYPPLQEYGGKRTLDELIDDPIMYNAAVMNRAKEHNTFLRGVHKLLPKQKDKLSKDLGRQLDEIEAMKESAVRYAPYTGAGRSSLGHTPKGIGANYSSNMFNQALGYAVDDMQPLANGMIATIRRPIDYTNFRANKAQFILDNDFTLNNPKSIIRDEYVANPILMKGKANPKFKELQKEYLKNKNLFEVKNPEFDNGVPHRSIGEHYYKNKSGDIGPYEQVVPKKIQSIEDYMQYHHDYGIEEVPNPLSVKILEAAKTKFNTDKLNHNLVPFLDDLYKYSKKFIKERGENNLDNEINRALSQIKNEYVKKHYKKYAIEAKNYAIEQLGLKSGILKPRPNDRIILHKGLKVNNSLFDNKYRGHKYPFSERVVTSTRNTGDPRQHFIFTGPINKKGFDLIDFTKVTPELLEMPYSRAHFLKFMKHTPGTSRKSYKYGGTNK